MVYISHHEAWMRWCYDTAWWCLLVTLIKTHRTLNHVANISYVWETDLCWELKMKFIFSIFKSACTCNLLIIIDGCRDCMTPYATIFFTTENTEKCSNHYQNYYSKLRILIYPLPLPPFSSPPVCLCQVKLKLKLTYCWQKLTLTFDQGCFRFCFRRQCINVYIVGGSKVL